MKLMLARTAMTLLVAMLASAWARAEITYTATAGTPGYDGESYPNLVDGDKTNKWCCNPIESGSTIAFIEFQSSEPITPKGYVITTANDTKENPDRNPKKWTISAKANAADDWTDLVAVTRESRLPAENFEDCIYGIANNTAYQYFRIEISELQSYCFQLAEFAFLTDGVDDKDLSMAKIMGLESNYMYTGSAIDLSTIYVVDVCETAIAPGDYKVVITNSSNEEVTTVTEPGTYTLTILPNGDKYHGSLSASFSVSLWSGEGGFCGKSTENGGKNLYYELTTTSLGRKKATVKKNPYVATTSDFGIGDNVFKGNHDINEVSIEEGVTSIGKESFRNCTNLYTVTIPEGLTLIGDGAFYNCFNLSSINIPASVTSIGAVVFFNVKLASITVASGSTNYKIEGNCLIETATNKLMLGCDTSVIPATVTSIGSNAFYQCYDLTSITLPEGLTTIYKEAFNQCALTSITIPAGVTSIGEGAFTYCSDIADVYCYADPTKLTWEQGLYDFAYRSSSDKTKIHVFDVADWSAFDSWYYAQYVGDLVLDFADGSDNFTTAAKFDGRKVNVKLDGRTLIQDGDWNTFCVPFNVTLAGSPLDGAEARTLTAASFDAGLLTLTFGDPVTSLVAGTPYIIKWATSGEGVANPTFYGVTIDKTLRDFVSADTKVSFLGEYLMHAWVGDCKDNLAMGANNTLYTPLDGARLPSFSAYFAVETGSDAPILRTVMNFGDGTTGIVSRSADSEELKEYFDLSGRRIFGTPAAKGIYIVNGKKVVVP